jgi:hypothetical protein
VCAAASGIRFEIGSGKFEFSLHGAIASRLIVDQKQHTWTCTDGLKTYFLSVSVISALRQKLSCRFFFYSNMQVL